MRIWWTPTFENGNGGSPIIKIPKDVIYIMPGTFYGLWTTSFEVAPENRHYMSDDGVLFTKDGKTLVAFPYERTGEYIIPNGVRRIASYAFRDSSVESIVLPSSLRRIDWCAFMGCHATMTMWDDSP